MTTQMGPEIENAMKRDFPLERVAPVVAWLAHADAPCKGESSSVGGGHFARIFIAETRGYASPTKETIH